MPSRAVGLGFGLVTMASSAVATVTAPNETVSGVSLLVALGGLAGTVATVLMPFWQSWMADREKDRQSRLAEVERVAAAEAMRARMDVLEVEAREAKALALANDVRARRAESLLAAESRLAELEASRAQVERNREKLAESDVQMAVVKGQQVGLMQALLKKGVLEVPSEEIATVPAPARVLIVDDDQQTVDQLSRLLALVGCQAEGAYTVKNAIAYLADDHPHRPDWVLLDINLGVDAEGREVDGLEVLRHVQAHCPECRVIVLTAHPERAAAARAAGADHVLEKPFDFDVLRRLIVSEAGPRPTSATDSPPPRV